MFIQFFFWARASRSNDFVGGVVSGFFVGKFGEVWNRLIVEQHSFTVAIRRLRLFGLVARNFFTTLHTCTLNLIPILKVDGAETCHFL